jgi:hypothetical protein
MQIVVKVWSCEKEEFIPDNEIDPQLVQRLKYSKNLYFIYIYFQVLRYINRFFLKISGTDILEFEPHMGAYPLVPTPDLPTPTYKTWLSWTSFITQPLLHSMIAPTDPYKACYVSAMDSTSRFSQLDASILKELQQRQGDFDSSIALLSKSFESVSSSSSNNTMKPDMDAEGLIVTDPTYIKFTPFNLKRSFPSNASPSEITKYSKDKSYLLRTLIANSLNSGTLLNLSSLYFSAHFFKKSCCTY